MANVNQAVQLAASETPALNYQRGISEVISHPGPGRIPFSIEFMPPRDDAAEERIKTGARAFHDLGAAFVSVTYGAGGSSRARTERVALQMARWPLTTLVHLTLVGHTKEELTQILREYANLGLSNLLALRGDPPGDPLGDWQPVPGGLTYARELIELVQSLPECRHFEIGVASFPEKHYRATDLEADTFYTLEKLRAGAQYSITQMFFDIEHYLRLRDRLAAADPVHGTKPVIPGLMPITSLRSVRRQLELSGGTMPRHLQERLEKAAAGDEQKNAAAIRAEGIAITTELAERLIAEGAPDLHFMSLNFTKPTQEVLHNLGMGPASFEESWR